MKMHRALTACFLLGIASTSASAADKVRVRLNWMYYGSHAGFTLGKDKGIYEKYGIDLDIRSGNGSGSAHRLVANGDSTFSYGSCASMVNLASQGAPLMSVAVIDAEGTDGILVRPDAGVKTVADLSGKLLLTTANAGVNTFFPLVLRNAKVAEGSVKIVNVAEGALITGYLQKSGGAVGILGGLDDKPSEIVAAGGEKPIGLSYADYGVTQVGYCIVGNTALLAKSPDLAKRFVTATIEAYKLTEADPKAAVAVMADVVGGTMNEQKGKDQALDVLNVTLGVLYSKANTSKKLGLHVASDWDAMLDLMKTYNNLKTDKPASAFYTNDFLP